MTTDPEPTTTEHIDPGVVIIATSDDERDKIREALYDWICTHPSRNYAAPHKLYGALLGLRGDVTITLARRITERLGERE